MRDHQTRILSLAVCDWYLERLSTRKLQGGVIEPSTRTYLCHSKMWESDDFDLIDAEQNRILNFQRHIPAGVKSPSWYSGDLLLSMDNERCEQRTAQ